MQNRKINIVLLPFLLKTINIHLYEKENAYNEKLSRNKK